MRSFAEYLHYFRSIADMHTSIRSFVHGDVDRIINLERSKLLYPVLWLETPEISQAEGKITFSGAFVILINTKARDWAQEDRVLERTYRIASEVIQRMQEDSATGMYTFMQACRLSDISTLTHDADYGWRCTYELEVDCYQCLPAVYQNDWTEFMMPVFRWAQTDKKGFNIEFKNESIYPDGVTWRWDFASEDFSGQQLSEEIGPYEESGATKPLKVTLTMMSADDQFSASATAEIFPGQIMQGYSYPDPLKAI